MKFKKTVLTLGIIGMILGLMAGVGMLYLANDIKGDKNLGTISLSQPAFTIDGRSNISQDTAQNIKDFLATHEDVSIIAHFTGTTLLITLYLLLIAGAIVFIVNSLFTLISSIFYYRGKKMFASALVLGILNIVSVASTGSLIALAVGILMIVGATDKRKELKKIEVKSL